MVVSKESLAEQIYKEVRERIVNVEIEPGEKINVSRLEKDFGVSRAPIREALNKLANQGLVVVKPRVGYFAVKLTPKRVKDICELRKLFEVYALRQSIDQISRSEIEKLMEQTIELKEDELPSGELRERFDETDEELHKVIINQANNELLKDFTERIHYLVGLTRHLKERIQSALDEHIAILKAMRGRNSEEATKALGEHLDNVEDEILNNFDC